MSPVGRAAKPAPLAFTAARRVPYLSFLPHSNLHRGHASDVERLGRSANTLGIVRGPNSGDRGTLQDRLVTPGFGFKPAAASPR